MSLSSRTLRCSVLALSCLLPIVCAAQLSIPQFIQPIVEYTGGQVTSFVPGNLQYGLATQDILYVNAPTVSGSTSSVLVGELLSVNQGQGITNLGENQITFPNVSNAVAALADFNNDGRMDYAFALTRTATGGAGPNLCVYYGSGNGLNGDAYDGPGPFPAQYPPDWRQERLPDLHHPGQPAPVFSYIAAANLINGQQDPILRRQRQQLPLRLLRHRHHCKQRRNSDRLHPGQHHRHSVRGRRRPHLHRRLRRRRQDRLHHRQPAQPLRHGLLRQRRRHLPTTAAPPAHQWPRQFHAAAGHERRHHSRPGR